MNLNDFTNKELIETYSKIISLLKERNIIRTKNLIGDLGEYLAIDLFNKTPGMSNLLAAPAGTQNIDAISRNGERYSVKSTTGNLTGVFYGLEPKGSSISDSQKFEYVLIVKFSDNYELEKIIQVDWLTFLNHKKWHSTMRAWNLSLTKELERDSLIIFKK
jgi:hypothetical protein